MRGSGITRRQAMRAGAAASLGLLAAQPVRAATGARLRVAALDWGLASTVAAIGAGPMAVAERDGYARWVSEPALPPDVVELGLRTTPSLETLAALKPDLILTSSLNAGLENRLAAIAPTLSNAIYTADHKPYAHAATVARQLGDRLDRIAQAEALIDATARRIAAAGSRLRAREPRRLIPVGFMDARYVRIYGAGSLFDDVMQRMGLVNGWAGETNLWGFSLVSIEALAACRDADLVVIEPTPVVARSAMEHNGLWSSLVAASGARIYRVPPVWAFGDLCAAGRCADLLAAAFNPEAVPEAASAPGAAP